ncbi:hypothetical protein P4S72_06370 [Vibrio sp. PP-XX7]
MIQSIPAKLKRDLRDLLNFSDTRQLATTEQIIRLLDLYERSVKIMTSNPGIHQQHTLPLIEKELISQLADELQTLIAKLDFSGEAGDMLMDIGARIIVEIPPKQLSGTHIRSITTGDSGNQIRKKSVRDISQTN